MRINPAHRAEQVEADIQGNRSPSGEYTESMRAYRTYIENGGQVAPGSIEEHVFTVLHGDDQQREIVEALLIGGCPDDGAAVLGISEQAMRWYRELFFDTEVFGTRLGLYSYVRRECGGCGLKDDGAVMTQEEWESRPLKQIAYDCGYRYVLGLYAGSSAYEGKDGQSFAHERLLSYLMYAGTQAGHNLVALGRASSTPENAAAAKENFGILSKAYEQFRDAVPADDTGPTFYEIIFNSEEPEELRMCAGRRLEEIKPEEFA